MREFQPGESPSQGVSVVLSPLGQRQSGEAGVLARWTPRGFTMASETDDRKLRAHGYPSSEVGGTERRSHPVRALSFSPVAGPVDHAETN
jgi:hypothetical protein